VTNTGLIEATGPAGLGLYSYINNTGGIIKANSVVYLNGSTILGGTLEGSGAFIIPDNYTGSLEGAINLLGTITLQSTGDQTTLDMVPYYTYSNGKSTLSNPTLSGGGNIVLSGPNSQITGPSYYTGPITFVNAGVTISGGGIIGGSNLALNNQTKGIVDANSYSPLIVDTGANTVTNSGILEATAGGELFIASNLSNTGSLYASNGTILIAGTITGTGTATINGTGQVEFGAASSNGVKFAAGSTGELILDDSKQYTGTVSGFGTNTTQSIDLTDINFATATETYSSGTLTIKDTQGDVAHIKFSGTHTLASFNFQDDGQGGVLVTDPPKQHLANTALLGNYMATSFVTPFDGHGGTLFTEAAHSANQLVSLTTPHTG
jgi:hypothetical protein